MEEEEKEENKEDKGNEGKKKGKKLGGGIERGKIGWLMRRKRKGNRKAWKITLKKEIKRKKGEKTCRESQRKEG